MNDVACWAADIMQDLPKTARARLVNGELVLTQVNGALTTTRRRIADQIERRAPVPRRPPGPIPGVRGPPHPPLPDPRRVRRSLGGDVQAGADR
jgi:hypothetical protein